MNNLSRRTLITGASASLLATVLKPCSAQQPPAPVPIPIAESQRKNYFDCVETHFDRLIHYSLDRFGSTRSGMWMSSLDIHTNELLRLPEPAAGKDRRYIPGAYWYADQAMIVAADAVATRSACKCYADSVDEYLRSYFHFAGKERAFQAQLQIYWDASSDEMRMLPFHKQLDAWHTPAWETLWRYDRDLTQRIIRLGSLHTNDNKLTLLPELTTAIDSLHWLIQNSEQKNAQDQRLIRAMAKTGLAQCQMLADGSPVQVVWRAGRFSTLCLRVARAAGLADLREIGLECTRRMLPALARIVSTTDCSLDASRLKIAQHCVDTYARTRSTDSKSLANQFAEQLSQCDATESIPEQSAEQYGRSIYFLLSAAKVLERPEFAEAAKRLADQSIEHLFSDDCGMFRSRIGVDRCDAVDGIGCLMLALLAIDGDDPTSQSAFSF